MIQRFKKYTKRKKYFWLVFFVTFLGLLFRSYKYFEYYFFQIDQARNWLIVKQALEEGAGELPLLGARAGGTFFRLGPFYNYLEYLCGLLFGSFPPVLGLGVLFFSVLTIPLFYLFLREFFSRKIAFLLVFLFSISLYAIEYSRFSWNPNIIPFFVLVVFYSLLKISSGITNLEFKIKKTKQRLRQKLKQFGKNPRQSISFKKFRDIFKKNKSNSQKEFTDYRTWFWALAGSIALGIVVQLHGLTLVLMPVMVLAYFLLTKTRISLKQALISISIILFLNSPFILNDYLTGFGNTREFFKAYLNKQNVNQEYTFYKKSLNGIHELCRYYALIPTSRQFIIKLDQRKRSEGLVGLIKRNLDHPKEIQNLILSFIAFSGIIYAYFELIKKYPRLKKKKHSKKRNFILLVLIWQLGFLPSLLLLSIKVDSRYFLGLVFIPFILGGVYFQKISRFNYQKLFSYFKKILRIPEIDFKKFQRIVWGDLFLYLIFLGLVFINILGISGWFNILKNYQQSQAKNFHEEFILEKYYDVTFEQYNQIVDYIKKDYQENPKPIEIYSNPYYIRSIVYLLRSWRNLPAQEIDEYPYKQNRHYYFIDDTKTPEKRIKDLPKTIEKYFLVKSYKNFGTLTLFEIEPKKQALESPKPKSKPKPDQTQRNEKSMKEKKQPKEKQKHNPADKEIMPEKYNWKEIFTKIRSDQHQ
ncbi:MAG: hypothetical protein GF335_03670 [Candidatus Moranbacteria bacterium]|nr:hypothetical protein [Candidatus Moranbacteria bacterium]